MILSRSAATDNEAAGSLLWLEVGYPHRLLDWTDSFEDLCVLCC